METYQIVSLAAAAVVFVLYLMRRRSRLNREDESCSFRRRRGTGAA